MYPVSSNGLNRETDDAVYFFTPAFHALDNFSAHAVEIYDHIFPTVEHAFQWKKFEHEPQIALEIFGARSPEAVKKVSARFKDKILSSWHTSKLKVMEEICRAKLMQHEDVQEILLKTENRRILENSPVDSFWGIGPNNSGENNIGKIWMKLREELKNQ